MSSKSIYNLVRGLTKPYIGAHFEHKDKEYKVWATEILSFDQTYKNIEPGKIIKVYSDNSFIVKTGDGLLKIIDVDSVNLIEGEYL